MVRTRIDVSTDEHLAEISEAKKSGTFTILYTSLWDSRCEKIHAKVEKWLEQEGDETLYVINSWDTPAAFSMFMVTNVPTLVHVKAGRVKVNVEYPTIYRYFDVT